MLAVEDLRGVRSGVEENPENVAKSFFCDTPFLRPRWWCPHGGAPNGESGGSLLVRCDRVSTSPVLATRVHLFGSKYECGRSKNTENNIVFLNV